MKLSSDFTLEEFTRSRIATEESINNSPNAAQVEALRALVVNIIQPARTALGFAISVDSGFRSLALNNNKRVKGAKNSQHLNGEAADLICKDNAALFDWIASHTNFDQLIWEFGNDDQPEWVHVSYAADRPNRRSKLQAIKENGITQYIVY